MLKRATRYELFRDDKVLMMGAFINKEIYWEYLDSLGDRKSWRHTFLRLRTGNLPVSTCH